MFLCTKDDMTSFLRIKRQQAKKTLREVAEATGSKFTWLSKVETLESHDLTKDLLKRLAIALDIDIDVLMVNNGYLPDSFYTLRKKDPETLTKAIKKTLRKLERSVSEEENE